MGRKVVEAIDAVDVSFIAATLCPVDAADKRKLLKAAGFPVHRPPRLTRCVTAHQFKARTTQTAENEALPAVTRKRAKIVLFDFPNVQVFSNLFGEEGDVPWGKN